MSLLLLLALLIMANPLWAESPTMDEGRPFTKDEGRPLPSEAGTKDETKKPFCIFVHRPSE